MRVVDFLENLLKKNELRRKISKLQSEIRELNQLIADYNSYKSSIELVIANWVLEKINYDKIILKSVQLQSYFEGVSAENVKGRLLPIIADIGGASSKMVDICSAIPGQVSLINEKITELNGQVEILEAELAALG